MKRSILSLSVVLIALVATAMPLAPETCPAPAPGTFSVRVKQVARSIARHEGFCIRGTIAERQHNPGGLIYVGQVGAKRGSRGYASFDDDVAGYLALLRDLEYKTAAGLNLGQIMRRWNMANGGKYAAIVARETGIGEAEMLQ